MKILSRTRQTSYSMIPLFQYRLYHNHVPKSTTVVHSGYSLALPQRPCFVDIVIRGNSSNGWGTFSRSSCSNSARVNNYCIWMMSTLLSDRQTASRSLQIKWLKKVGTFGHLALEICIRHTLICWQFGIGLNNNWYIESCWTERSRNGS